MYRVCLSTGVGGRLDLLAANTYTYYGLYVRYSSRRLTACVLESRDKLESAASRNKIHLRYAPAVTVGNRDEPVEIKLLFIG